MPAGASYRRDGDVIEFVIERPERRNALGAAEWALLEAALAETESREVNTVVLRAEGDFFCAGVDLGWIEAKRKDGRLLQLIEDNGETMTRLDSLPQLVIVAVNGPALGVGAHLALCGDILLMGRSSYLAFPEAKLGIPDVMHMRLLEQRLGRNAAIDMVVLGQRLSAEEAKSRGLAGRVLDDADALNAALEDYLVALRAVDPAVRRAIKSAARGRADADLQLKACATVMRGGNGS